MAQLAAGTVEARGQGHPGYSVVARLALLAERGDAFAEVRAGPHPVAQLLIQLGALARVRRSSR